jgi:hypothetical protein
VQELKRGKEVQKLTRAANDWASRLATNACNRYMGQPLCERLDCRGIENCTPVEVAFRKASAFQKPFGDATVEDIKFKGVEGPSNRPFYLAAVKFSNGEVVVFTGGPQAARSRRGGRAQDLDRGAFGRSPIWIRIAASSKPPRRLFEIAASRSLCRCARQKRHAPRGRCRRVRQAIIRRAMQLLPV